MLLRRRRALGLGGLLILAQGAACGADDGTVATVLPAAAEPGGGAVQGAPPPAASLPAPSPSASSTQPSPPPGAPDASRGPDASSEEAGAEPPPPPPEPAIPYVAFDVNHVLSTGQSNSVAHGAVPVLTTTQPFTNLMFDVGVMTSAVCEASGCRAYEKPTALVPLTEGDAFWYPVETMSSGLGNEAAMLAKTRRNETHSVLVSLAGRNGLTYWCLRKGTCYHDPSYLNAYAESMRQVADGRALAAAAGRSYVVRLVTAIHGESDDFGYATHAEEFPNAGSDGTPGALASYADALLEWQRDYEAGVQAITGQTQAVPLLISQFSGWNDAPTSRVSALQYEAHRRAPGKVVLVAPAYTLDWAVDCRHYTAHGERRLGEYFAKAYARIVLEGRRWEPLHPGKVTRAGSVITARFVVPVPPLILDTARVTDPGNYGFEVVDEAGAPVAITGVALAGADAVTVTVATAPRAGWKLRYAFTGTPRTCPGNTRGPRGNLRDSDATPSNYGYELFNWAVHFEVPIE